MPSNVESITDVSSKVNYIPGNYIYDQIQQVKSKLQANYFNRISSANFKQELQMLRPLSSLDNQNREIYLAGIQDLKMFIKNHNIVKNFWEAESYLDITQHEEHEELVYCVINGEAEKLSVLLSQGASISYQDNNTILHVAVEKNQSEIVKIILKSLIENNHLEVLFFKTKPTDFFGLANRGGKQTAFILAIQLNQEKIFNQFLELNKDVLIKLIRDYDYRGWSVLHYAAQNGNFYLVEKFCYLMNNEPDYLVWLNKHAEAGLTEGKETAVILATKNGHNDIVTYLKNKTADLNARSQSGWNVFCYALYNENNNLMLSLINDGHTETNLIFEEWHPWNKTSLIPTKSKMSCKSTLDLAIYCNAPIDVVKHIINESSHGFLLNQNKDGYNSLHHAIWKERLDYVHFIFEKANKLGISSLLLEQKTSKDQFTPFQLAKNIRSNTISEYINITTAMQNATLTEDQRNELQKKRNDLISPTLPPIPTLNISNWKLDKCLLPTPWPTGYVYAQLAEHVYRDLKIKDIPFIQRDKKIIPLSDWVVRKIYNNKETGYYAAEYINLNTRHIILMHRGTEFILKDIITSSNDWLADIQGVVLQEFTAQQKDVYYATLNANEFAKKYGYKLSTGGHSLGGWEAGLSTIYAYREGYSCIHTVAFDAPGFADVVNRADAQLQPLTVEEWHSLDVTIYLGPPNAVNTMGKHLPDVTIIRIYPELQKNADFSMLLKATLAHKIDGIVDTFDPEIKLPREMQVVKDWPMVDGRHRTHRLSHYLSAIVGLISFLGGYRYIRDLRNKLFLVLLGSAITAYVFPQLRLNEISKYSLFKFLIFAVLGEIDTKQIDTFYHYAKESERLEPYDIHNKSKVEINQIARYAIKPFSAKSLHLTNELKKYIVLLKMITHAAPEENFRRKLLHTYDHSALEKNKLILKDTNIKNFDEFVILFENATNEFLKDPEIPHDLKINFRNELINIKERVDTEFRYDVCQSLKNQQDINELFDETLVLSSANRLSSPFALYFTLPSMLIHSTNFLFSLFRNFENHLTLSDSGYTEESRSYYDETLPEYQSSVGAQCLLLQLVLFYLSPWLPWNQERILAVEEIDKLKENKTKLNVFYDDLANIQSNIVAESHLFDEQLSWLDKTIREMRQKINSILKKQHVTESKLDDIDNKIMKIKKLLDNLVIKEEELLRMEEQSKALTLEGKRYAITYDYVKDVLKFEIENIESEENIFSSPWTSSQNTPFSRQQQFWARSEAPILVEAVVDAYMERLPKLGY